MSQHFCYHFHIVRHQNTILYYLYFTYSNLSIKFFYNTTNQIYQSNLPSYFILTSPKRCLVWPQPQNIRIRLYWSIIISYMEGMSRLDNKNLRPSFPQQHHPKYDYQAGLSNTTSLLLNFSKKPTSSSSPTPRCKPETTDCRNKYHHQFETCSKNQPSKRAHSATGRFTLKPSLRQSTIDKKNSQAYNQNLLQLKLEQMTFKFKTKIASLLKTIQIPIHQFSKFTSLIRIDDILDFLSTTLNNKATLNEASKYQNSKTFGKERELLIEYQQQIQLLKKKLVQKDGVEKTYKAKLRESHSQIRELYDSINQKQRELSQKMTEIYQLRSASKQSDKVFENYKLKWSATERELNEKNQKQALEVKRIMNNYKNIEEHNQELKQSNQELNQIIDSQNQKYAKIIQLNQHLNEQLARWKVRFESGSVCQAAITNSSCANNSKQHLEAIGVNPLAGKLSTVTLQNQISRLNYKIKDLQKQNRYLTKESTNFSNTKQKYEDLLACINAGTSESTQTSQKSQLIGFPQKWKQMLTEKQLFELTYFHKKKIEEVIKQWRDKMIDMIGKNEQDQANFKKQIGKLQKSNQQLQNKVYQLANQKYLIANQLIQKDRLIYQMTKSRKESSNSSHSPDSKWKFQTLNTAHEGQTSHQSSGIESLDQKNV